jgi:hypothetical protein
MQVRKRSRNGTYLLTSWSRVLEKLTGLQLVKKFPAFYGTQRFITAFKSARHPSLSLTQLNSVYTTTPHILEIHLNRVFQSTPGSPQWSISLRFPHQNLYTCLSPSPAVLHASPISFRIAEHLFKYFGKKARLDTAVPWE